MNYSRANVSDLKKRVPDESRPFLDRLIREGARRMLGEAEKKWRRLNGYKLVIKVLSGTQYIDGEEVTHDDTHERMAA